MIAKITVTLKEGLLDAQGKTVKGALEALGFKGVEAVRIGKYIEVDLEGVAAPAAKKAIERMCRQVLTNPVIETYAVAFAAGSTKRVSRVKRRVKVRR